jgi:hypothetical protein
MSANEMSDEELDAHFRELVDLFIDQGNELAKNSNSENIGLALLHAASRYSAFVVSSHAQSLAQYEKDIVGAKSYFQAEYSNMLDENFEDYKQVYVNKPVDANAS